MNVLNPPRPSVAPYQRFDEDRAAMMRAFRSLLASGADASEIAEEIEATGNAMRGLLQLTRGGCR